MLTISHSVQDTARVLFELARLDIRSSAIRLQAVFGEKSQQGGSYPGAESRHLSAPVGITPPGPGRFEAIDANCDQKIIFEELRDFLQRYRPGG
jgi:hypothetical protein